MIIGTSDSGRVLASAHYNTKTVKLSQVLYAPSSVGRVYRYKKKEQCSMHRLTALGFVLSLLELSASCRAISTTTTLKLRLNIRRQVKVGVYAHVMFTSHMCSKYSSF